MTKWYVGTMNDAAFIIDRPPRPSHDDMVDIAGVSVIGCLGTDFEGAKRIVDVHNALFEALDASDRWICDNTKAENRPAKFDKQRIDALALAKGALTEREAEHK